MVVRIDQLPDGTQIRSVVGAIEVQGKIGTVTPDSGVFTEAEIEAPLLATSGGTGFNTFTIGDIFVADSATTLAKISPNATTTPLVLTQYGDGSEVTTTAFQPIPVLGSLVYYFTDTPSDISTYYDQTSTPLETPENISNAGVVDDQLLVTFATELNNPGLTDIPDGQYSCHIFAAKTAGTQTAQLRAEIWEVDSAGVDIAKITDLGNTTNLTGSSVEYFIADSVPEYTLTNTSSRIVTKIYAVISGIGTAPNVVIYMGDTEDSRTNLPGINVSVNNFVPYTGATGNVNIGSNTMTASGFTGALTGNASTATALQTARAIYGNNFDGSVALTQVIASTYGGTGNGFTKFSGAASTEKTYTLPNASCNILTDNQVTYTISIAPATDLTVTGTVISATAGENLAYGDIVYIKSDGKLWKGDADASLFPVQYMATATILANASGVFLKDGYARNDAWTWTIGGAIYLSATAGGMTQTAPSSSGAGIQIVGYAHSATIIKFLASPDYATHA